MRARCGCTRPSRRAGSGATRPTGWPPRRGCSPTPSSASSSAYTYHRAVGRAAAPRRLRPGAGADLRVARPGAADDRGADGRRLRGRADRSGSGRVTSRSTCTGRPTSSCGGWPRTWAGPRSSCWGAGSCRWCSARSSSTWRCPARPADLAARSWSSVRSGWWSASRSAILVALTAFWLLDGAGVTQMAWLAGHVLLRDAAAAERLPRACSARSRGRCRGRRCSRCPADVFLGARTGRGAGGRATPSRPAGRWCCWRPGGCCSRWRPGGWWCRVAEAAELAGPAGGRRLVRRRSRRRGCGRTG